MRKRCREKEEGKKKKKKKKKEKERAEVVRGRATFAHVRAQRFVRHGGVKDEDHGRGRTGCSLAAASLPCRHL